MGADFLKQNEVAFQYELHLYLVEQHGLLLILRVLVLLLGAEVVNLLIELWMLLQIVLELVNRFLSDLVELVLLALDRSRLF